MTKIRPVALFLSHQCMVALYLQHVPLAFNRLMLNHMQRNMVFFTNVNLSSVPIGFEKRKHRNKPSQKCYLPKKLYVISMYRHMCLFSSWYAWFEPNKSNNRASTSAKPQSSWRQEQAFNRAQESQTVSLARKNFEQHNCFCVLINLPAEQWAHKSVDRKPKHGTRSKTKHNTRTRTRTSFEKTHAGNNAWFASSVHSLGLWVLLRTLSRCTAWCTWRRPSCRLPTLRWWWRTGSPSRSSCCDTCCPSVRTRVVGSHTMPKHSK